MSLMGVLAASLVEPAAADHAVFGRARNLLSNICTPFVTLVIVGVGCCQSIAADAFVNTFKDDAVVTYSGQTTDLLAGQVLEMNQILRELARVSEAARRDTQTMSQARIDALLLKNSIVKMASSLDRYRAFLSSFYR
jgi:hypothetical protein